MLDRSVNRTVLHKPIPVALANSKIPHADGVVANISEVGGCVFTTANFDVGEGVVVTLGGPWVPQPLEAQGRIVWTSKGSPATTQYGVRFATTRKLRRRLKELIDRLAAESLPSEPPGGRLPSVFGRYEVEGLVGEGSMGRVYRARDPMANRIVAIKTLKNEYLTSTHGEDYVKRFRKEAQASANLAHPNIITLFDVGDRFFVMEFVDGLTLHTLLQRTGCLELSEVLRIVGPVADGLDYAHSKGIIHRDIKPSNIMILPDGRPKIMDFGVAHFVSTTVTSAGELVGSPSYMAPEQITASHASARTDLFSLAVVAYEMLTGRKCFQGESIPEIVHSVVNVEPVPPSSHNPALPPRFDQVFRRALAKEPSVRFPNGSSFVAALGRRSADAVLSQAIPEVAPSTGEDGLAAIADVPTHDLDALPLGRPELTTARAGAPPRRSLARRVSLLYVLGTLALGAVILAFGLRHGGTAGPRAESPQSIGTGAIDIATEPAGASVQLDGVKAGTSPLTLSALRPGRHALKIDLLGFSSAELMLDVPVGAFAVPLRFTLQPASAIFQLHSEPEGAEVFVDGQASGRTPVETLSLPPGKHRVELTREGYAPWSQVVQIRGGDRIPLLGRLQAQGNADAARAHLRSQGWVHQGDFLEPGPDLAPPRKISGEAALYPESARRLGLRGTVTVEMTVSEQGEVSELRVVDSAGEILDAAVLAAVRTWRYAPAQKNGVKVQTRLRVEQTFGPGPSGP